MCDKKQTECVYCKHPLPFDYKDPCPNCGRNEPLIRRVTIGDNGTADDSITMKNKVLVKDEGKGKETIIKIVKTFTIKNWYLIAIVLIITYGSPWLFYYGSNLSISKYTSGLWGVSVTYIFSSVTLILGLYMIITTVKTYTTKFE